MNQQLTEAILAAPLRAVADYYAQCLEGNERAMDFVRAELKFDAEQASRRRIGFSDRSLGTMLPHKRIKSGREVRQLLVSIGLYKGNGRETLRGCVTVPVVDESGKTIAIRGYRLDAAAGQPPIVVERQSAVERQSPVACDAASVERQSPVATNGQPAQPSTVNRQGTADLPRAVEQQSSVACDAATVEQQSAIAPNGQPAQASTVNRQGTADLPPAAEPPTDDELILAEEQLLFHCDDRRWRIRGLEKNASLVRLQVNLMVSRDGLMHLDCLDLVKAAGRGAFVKAAAAELYVDEATIKRDLGRLLMKLETLQAERLAELKRPRKIELTDAERDEAMQLLRDPQLLVRIVADLDACGIVGERTGKLAGYLAAVSRKLDKPLAIVIQSSSSAGKTSLMDAVLAMIPEEDQLRLSNLTGQSLYYLDSADVRHKILAVSEGEGISQAAYALKLLQSEGRLSHATVGKGDNGRMTTQRYTVEGPVSLFLTTTALEVDEELVNRCLLLAVDESRGQTKAIQRQQRNGQTCGGTAMLRRIEAIRRLHRNAQRLLEPLAVYNPYAAQLTFPSHKTRLRRDHLKYLTLIRAIALLHQHSRPIETDAEGVRYVNVTPRDIAVAGAIAAETLGRSLDELPPQTRSFLGRLDEFVVRSCREQELRRSEFRFTRRDVREALGWTDWQSRTHLDKLLELEYLVIHRGSNGRRYVYELLYDGGGRQGQPFLPGLVDPERLQPPTHPQGWADAAAKASHLEVP